MIPTKSQKARRNKSFEFTYKGVKSWFYLCEEDGASFHQPTSQGQQNVYGLRISTLLNALKKCGYIALFLCLPAVVEAKMEIGDGPPGNVTAAEIWADQKAKHKQVVIPYADFLVMVSKVEHSKKLKDRAMAENGVLVKLKGEYETIIKIQADQIQACEAIVQSQEQLGETQEKIGQAVEQKLTELTGQLTREKRLSRYKSETVWIGLIGLVVWVLN